METVVDLNVPPIHTPHRDLDHLPLADKDFQIKELTFEGSPVRIHCKCQDSYLNHANKIDLWEPNLPKYQLPSIHIFPKIVHQCHANYNPNLRAVMYPNQQILFNLSTTCYIYSLAKTLPPIYC